MKLFLTYLLEVSICQIALYLLYKFIFSRFTFYSWNRAYLLGIVLVSFIIPLLQFRVFDSQSALESSLQYFNTIDLTKFNNESAQISTQPAASINWLNTFIFTLSSLYMIGLIVYAFRFTGGILKINRTIRKHLVENKDGYKVIQVSSGPSFYSFLGRIFIHKKTKFLSAEEQEIAIRHEKLHIDLKHSYDVLFLEFARIVCWINPVIHLIKKEAVENHEFEVDQLMNKEIKDVYSNLILKLAISKPELGIVSQFSMKDMQKRINMIYQSNTNTMKKLYYLLIIPIMGVLLTIFSFTEKVENIDQTKETIHESELTIGKVTWEGNALYSDDYLTGFMKLKKGAIYNETEIQNLISYKADGSDLGSLYMDKGYLFFMVDIIEKKANNNQVDLTFKIYEGEVVHINNINLEGFPENTDYASIIPIKSGDIFNRSLLIKSQKILIDQVGNEIFIDPHPIIEKQLVNINFKYISK